MNGGHPVSVFTQQKPKKFSTEELEFEEFTSYPTNQQVPQNSSHVHGLAKQKAEVEDEEFEFQQAPSAQETTFDPKNKYDVFDELEDSPVKDR